MTTLFDGLADVFVGTFGETVTVLPQGGPLREITAVVKHPQEIEALDGGAVMTDRYIRAKSSDVSDLVYDDSIWVDDVEYKAGTPMVDTRGMTNIALRLA